MIALLEWLPLTLFFITYQYAGLYAATASIMVATTMQIAIYAILGKPISPLQWLGLGILTFMGSATLLFNNMLFIKWKPTIVYWVFASTFALSPYVTHTLLIKQMLGHLLTLPNTAWKKLNYYWVVCFSILGAVNIIVAYSVDTTTWVQFKLFGLFGLQLLFILLQAFYVTYLKTPYESSHIK